VTGPATRDVIELDRLSADEQYKLLSVAVQPRPIAWVSTVCPDGVANLAPFSFFTVASRRPATLLISVGERPEDPANAKDTLANIRGTGEFVVNIPGAEHADQVAATSSAVPADQDEFSVAGVAAVPSKRVAAPSVADALLSLECRFSQEVAVGTDVLVLGEVLATTVRAGLLDERLHVDIQAHPYLARLAGPYFSTAVHRVVQRSGAGVDPS
jgi:flavin reductase (DIM6/NTAB) family NADH-FMN oxidoreductase RutF